MGRARLNFSDHPDGSASCQSVWIGGFDASSPAHKISAIAQGVVDAMHIPIADSDEDLAEAGGREELATSASLTLTDEAGAIRIVCRYAPDGFVESSAAHAMCLKAHNALGLLLRAVGDAIITDSHSQLARRIPKAVINLENGHATMQKGDV